MNQTVEPALPGTRAGEVLASWLAAFNSGEPEQLRALAESYSPGPPPEQMVAIREMTGGFEVLRIGNSEPLSLVVLVKEKDGDRVAELDLSVSAEGPAAITKMDLRLVPRPAEFAIPRMNEVDALAAVSAYAAKAHGKDRFAGALLIARNEQILLERAWGLADRERGASVSLNTKFRLGSMNKMFTSIATLQLVEAGKMALDDTLGKHLPEYPNRSIASTVTVRQLLSHTGGTGDIFGPEFTKNRLTLRAHDDYVTLYGERAPTHGPGAEFRYSNYGFVLLGALIETVSGSSYYDYVELHILKPAGMDSTGSLPENTDVPNRAHGYMKRDGNWVSNAATLPWRGTAAGGGYSTAGDLLRFARALESGALVSKKTLADATQPKTERYGFGFQVRGEGPLRSYGHGGGAPGMNGELRVFPRLGYVLVGLSNLDPPAAARLVDYFEDRMPAIL